MDDMAMVIETAKREIREERFRAAVEKEKERLLQQRWWHRFFPFEIHITRRNKT